jgi:dCMP deaminase
MPRPSWDEYFIEITKLVATRSTCLRRKVGAIFVRDRRILATGYNGAPKGLRHCEEVGCLRERLKIPSGERHELCRGVHAEQNAIVQAATSGVNLEGATLYSTTYPCILCSKLIINAIIKRVVYLEEYYTEPPEVLDLSKGKKVSYLDGYPDRLAKEMLDEAGIVVERFDSG